MVGLGNPGLEYLWTPHNAGFMAIDRIAEQEGVVAQNRRCKAVTATWRLAGREVVLAKPETFMNLSGLALGALVREFEIDSARDLLVIYDELDLAWTSVRIKPKGSAAGHKGMLSVIGGLRTNEFVRVRLGIHPDHPIGDGAEFVLAPFRRSQIKELDELTGYAADAVRSIIAEGVEKAMTRFNRRAPGLQTEDA